VIDDLVVFLRARLDEEEATAKAAIRENPLGLSLCVHVPPEVQWHYNRHEPARALREVEAKRAILADYERALNFEAGFNDGDQPRQVLEMACRYHAATYRDHPDYRPEWEPVSPAG
jgi:hypothetical protein